MFKYLFNYPLHKKMMNKIILSLAVMISSSAFAVWNGEQASDSKWNMVIGYDIKGRKCTAVVIHPKILLTAAHCFNHLNDKNKSLAFELAIQNRDQFEHMSGRIIPHPKFDYNFTGATGTGGSKEFIEAMQNTFYDIAVIKLKDDITQLKGFSDIKGVRLLFKEEVLNVIQDKNEYTFVGMGLFDGSDEDNSQNIVKRLMNINKPVLDEHSIFKTNPSRSDQGACDADSGGPLFVTTKDGLRLVGILSAAAKPCGGARSMYLSYVPEHVCWVQKVSQIGITENPEICNNK